MEHLARLLERYPLVFVHLMTAAAALAVGLVLMARRKGTGSHRTLGWVWVVLMGTTAGASVFIRDYGMINVMGFTPIHLFTVGTAVSLPLGIWQVRHGRIDAHRQTMKGLFIGGCVLAGLFTLLPGRFLGTLLWKHALGVMA